MNREGAKSAKTIAWNLRVLRAFAVEYRALSRGGEGLCEFGEKPDARLRSRGSCFRVGSMLLSIIVPPRWKVAALFIAASLCAQGPAPAETAKPKKQTPAARPAAVPRDPAKATKPAQPSKPVPAATFTNHLAQEKSPYLLQHKHNPVDWYPWGKEAFEKAQKEDKPIFLSIGYSTCHWCHVMAHESFENEEIAKAMNESFVCVKLDREERPDIDKIYMTFVQASTGSGGWPMSVFLTPDLKPFFGGTYFRPDTFKSKLKLISDGWKKDRAGIAAHGETVLKALREVGAGTAGDDKGLNDALFMSALPQLGRIYDAELGGFGTAPKFPRPVTLNYLFRVFARTAAGSPESDQAKKMALHTLDKMAEGGMHDHLGGGFHRYSVDKFWHIPHFEKMLYDQAQLATSYLDAFQVTHQAAYEKTARDVLDYVRRDMTDKAGGFYSAEDADSLLAADKPEHAEGAFYVWTKAEITKVLGEDAAQLFNRVYGVEEGGNAPQGSDPMNEFKGKNTLIVRMSVADAAKAVSKPEEEVAKSLADSRKKLFDVRAKRPRPHLDDKIITAWNGLMISAYARGAQIFGDAAYLESAQNAAKFLRAEMWKEGHLLRSYRNGASEVKGFAEDYACLIQGLLDLYEADFDVAWLQWAVELQTKMDALFADEKGGYFSTAGDDPNVLLRMKEDSDSAEPSPNSVAVMNLLRLAEITGDSVGDKKLVERARKTLASFSEQLTQLPTAIPQMLCALDAQLQGLRHISIIGQAAAPETKPLLAVVRERYMPNKIVLLLDGGPGQEWLSERLTYLKSAKPQAGKTEVMICEKQVCQLPTADLEKLRELLAK